MATFTLTAEVGDAAGHLEQMGDRSTQLAPVFDKLVDALTKGEKSVYARNRWLPNEPATVARKILHGQDPRPMRATGATEHMLTVRGFPGQIARGGGTTLEFGAKSLGLHVATYSKNPRRKRDVLKIPPATRKAVRQIILDHIVGGP